MTDLNKPRENIEGKKNESNQDILPQRNVVFDGETVTFPETTLGNIDEAIKYLNEQRDLLMKKYREKNENVINEIDDIMKKCFEKWIEKDSGKDPIKRQDYYDNIINFLRNYNWDLSNFMKNIAGKFREHTNWGLSLCEDIGVILNRAWFSVRGYTEIEKCVNSLSDEQIIEIIKKDVDNIDKLWKARRIFDIYSSYWTADFYLSFLIKDVYDEYKKNYNPAKYL